MIKQYPKVSVIIPTYNESFNIVSAIHSIKQQIYGDTACPGIDIIVADGDSTDNTTVIARIAGAEIIRQGNKSILDNTIGSKYLFLMDADMVLTPNVIKECVEACENGFAGVYIPEIVTGNIERFLLGASVYMDKGYAKDNYWIHVRNFERSFYTGTCIDAIRFISRDTFSKTYGFWTHDDGNEWGLARIVCGIGRITAIESPLIHNEGNFTVKNYIGKKRKYINNGHLDKYKMRYKNDAICRKQLGFYYRFIGVFIEDSKWKKLLRHPILSLGMYFLRILVGIQYIRRRR